MNSHSTSDPAGARPLFLSTVVWGERFRNYLTDFQLRSLLAPGNLPADIGRNKRILICGPRDDWEALDRHEVVQAIRRYADVEWIEFEPARHRQIRSMAIGMALCLKRAKDCDAYLAQFPPDSIYCDNALQLMGSWIEEKLELVLVPAFRCEEGALLSELRLAGHGTDAISLKPAEINAAVLRSLHSQMRVTDIDSQCLYPLAHVFHIRDKENAWLVAKTMAWANAMFDLRNVSYELLDEAARSVMDSYILAKMYRPHHKIRFLPKLDDFALVTWAPSDWSALPVHAQWVQRMPVTKRLYNDFAARKSLRYYLMWDGKEDDWIKRRSLLDVTVMFGDEARHGGEMRAAGERLNAYLRGACPDLLNIGSRSPYMSGLDALDSVLRKFTFIADALLNRDDGRGRLLRRLQSYVRKFLPRSGNRAFHTP